MISCQKILLSLHLSNLRTAFSPTSHHKKKKQKKKKKRNLCIN